MRRSSESVFVADGPIVRVTRRDLDGLKGLAGDTKLRRVRLCAHQSPQDAVQEMLIALARGTYVRPHRHRNNSESFHVVEGALSVVLFGDDGQIREAIPLGDYASERAFYYRLAEPAYHTILVESTVAVIHETTNGPFDRAATEYAPWAPAEEDGDASRRYLRELARGQIITGAVVASQ